MGLSEHHKKLNLVQKNAIDRAIELLDLEQRCMIVMATGTGKTVVGAKIIQKHEDHKVLWITQTDELIQQTRNDLAILFGEEKIGIFRGKENDLSRFITIASIQSISRYDFLKKIKKDLFDLMIVDEAHHAGAVTWERVINYFKCKKLGLTATPIRNDGFGLEEIFGSSAFILNYSEAKEMKLIASETYRLILTNSVLNGIVTKKNEYAPEQLDKLVISKNRNKIILKSYLKYGRPFMKSQGLSPKAICFCIDVRHALFMTDFFSKNGIRSEVLVGTSGGKRRRKSSQYEMRRERARIYKQFLENDEIEMLCVVNILNEGKNIPNVGCLLLTRPTRSRVIFQQQIGRGCRRIEGKKEKFLVLDYVDLMNQKYPPMTLSRVLNKEYVATDFLLDFYKGKDEININRYIEYLSPNFQFFPEEKYTKPTIINRLQEFYKKNNKISVNDLIPSLTGLPARGTIVRHWGSIRECFLEADIPLRPRYGILQKEDVAQKLLKFYNDKGKIVITDLGTKNNLPSQKAIQNKWGSWTKCCIELGIYKPKFAKSNWVRSTRTLPTGIYNHGNQFRVDIWQNSKRIQRKMFRTLEEAVQFRSSAPHKKGKMNELSKK